VHQKNYWMATTVSVVFKLVAWLWVIGAVLAASNAGNAANNIGASGASQGGIVFVILAGGAVLACTSAIFGYVISLLRDIARNGETRPYLPASQWERHQCRPVAVRAPSRWDSTLASNDEPGLRRTAQHSTATAQDKALNPQVLDIRSWGSRRDPHWRSGSRPRSSASSWRFP
jgi:hypothetical protein